MKRPAWLDPSISFCKDTPDRIKPPAPVLIDIHQRGSQKVWKWGVEVDFIGRPAADAGSWANIDSIAHHCDGHPLDPGRIAAHRGNWVQFNFKTAKGALRFGQQTLLFVHELQAAGIGLLPQPKSDPRDAPYLKAQATYQQLLLQAKWEARR
jgi:hypothetical protein